MTFKKIILAGAVLAPFLFAAAPAEAREYCREYNKSITVGGRYESGYGTACMQPDGSWMIVESHGTVDPFEELRRERDVVIIADQRPVYYNYGPAFRPVTYYPRPTYRHYERQPGFFFSITNYERDRGHHHWNHDRRHHGHRWNGRGRGHDHHRHDNHHRRGRD